MSNSGEGKDYSDEFRVLLKKHNITQQEAANLITAETKKPLAARTVRAWLADKNARSKLKCPEWAIHSLKKRLEKGDEG